MNQNNFSFESHKLREGPVLMRNIRIQKQKQTFSIQDKLFC